MEESADDIAFQFETAEDDKPQSKPKSKPKPKPKKKQGFFARMIAEIEEEIEELEEELEEEMRRLLTTSSSRITLGRPLPSPSGYLLSMFQGVNEITELLMVTLFLFVLLEAQDLSYGCDNAKLVAPCLGFVDTEIALDLGTECAMLREQCAFFEVTALVHNEQYSQYRVSSPAVMTLPALPFYYTKHSADTYFLTWKNANDHMIAIRTWDGDSKVTQDEKISHQTSSSWRS